MDLEPRSMVSRLARLLPPDLAADAYVAGSLAAGFHFEGRLPRREMRTKDADLVVHAVGSHEELGPRTEKLLSQGWRWNPSVKFPPGSVETRVEELPFIRLFPPGLTDFFIEFLGQPEIGQMEAKAHGRVVVQGAHYGVPIFRFMGLTSWNLLDSGLGLKYADPAMMCLANLLSHPTLGTTTMETDIGGRVCLRSAKDLGRVLAIARLTPRGEQEAWVDRWMAAMSHWFPGDWRRLAGRVGSGLEQLVADPGALGEAHHTATHLGLLPGLGVSREQFAAGAGEFRADVLDRFVERCRNA